MNVVKVVLDGAIDGAKISRAIERTSYASDARRRNCHPICALSQAQLDFLFLSASGFYLLDYISAPASAVVIIVNLAQRKKNLLQLVCCVTCNFFFFSFYYTDLHDASSKGERERETKKKRMGECNE